MPFFCRRNRACNVDKCKWHQTILKWTVFLRAQSKCPCWNRIRSLDREKTRRIVFAQRFSCLSCYRCGGTGATAQRHIQKNVHKFKSNNRFAHSLRSLSVTLVFLSLSFSVSLDHLVVFCLLCCVVLYRALVTYIHSLCNSVFGL